VVWSVLIAGVGWPHALPLGASILASQLIVTANVLSRQGWKIGGLPAAALLGVAVGYALYPAAVRVISYVGQDLLGLDYASARGPGAGDPSDWLAALVLSPLFEESLYRGQLLPAMRAIAGPGAALLVTSALFALSHVTPWSALTTFLLGLALGSLVLVTGDLWLCIGLHAGLNLGLVVSGSPPQRYALPLTASFAVGLVCLAGLARLGRSGDA
jgi:membrane protease YdiL (CAAX protease family)